MASSDEPGVCVEVIAIVPATMNMIDAAVALNANQSGVHMRPRDSRYWNQTPVATIITMASTGTSCSIRSSLSES
jgi:hypothetical protein